MKSLLDSVKVKVLTVTTTVILAISLSGCNDPIASDMEARHQQLGNIAMQELQQNPFAYPSVSQTEAFSQAE